VITSDLTYLRLKQQLSSYLLLKMYNKMPLNKIKINASLLSAHGLTELWLPVTKMEACYAQTREFVTVKELVTGK
jgi:hypothetical protein